MKAKEWGLAEKIRVYDSGIFELAEKDPKNVVFLGKIMTRENARQKRISEKDFQSRTLTTVEFIARTKDEAYQVIDVRDLAELEDFPLEIPRVHHYLVDRFTNLLRAKSRKVTRKKLLILDNVGTQVVWLDYILQAEGYQDYFFLRGGILQWRLDEYDTEGVLD